MLKFELFPDGDVDVSLGRNGGNILSRRRLRLYCRRRRRYLVGTEALLDGLVLVFDAARACNEQNSIVLRRILASHLFNNQHAIEYITDATLTTEERKGRKGYHQAVRKIG